MTFSLSGDIITQSGIDTDLSNLTTIAGVTVEEGNYSIGARRLRITGTLTIDPEVESLSVDAAASVSGSTIRVSSGGHLIVGREISNPPAIRYSVGNAIKVTNSVNGSNFDETDAALRVDGGATFDWYGGIIESRRTVMAFMENSNVTIYSQNAIYLGPGGGQIRQRTDIDVRGLTTIGCFINFIGFPSNFDNWLPLDANNQVLSFSGTSQDNVFYPIRNFDSSNVEGQVLAVWSNVWGRLINNEKGTDVVIGGNNSTSSTSNRGLYEFRQEISVIPEDLSGNLLNNARLFIRDTNNGNRLSSNQIGNNPTYTPDRTYDVGVNLGSININTNGGVLVGVGYRTISTGGQLTNVIFDYRGVNNDNSDVFNLYFYEYNQNIITAPTELKGNNGTNFTRVFIPDLNITETDETVVAAYTGFSVNTASSLITITDGFPSNFDSLYDKSKEWKMSNFTDLFPSVASLLLAVSGTTLVLDNLTLDISNYSSTFVAGIKLETLQVNANSTINVGSGSTNLEDFEFVAGATINNTSASAATVQVSSTTGIVTTSTGGGAITLEEPQNSVILNGIPNVANAIVSVENLTTNVVTYPTVTGTSITVVLDAGTSYEIHCDAPGYLLQSVIIPGNTPQFTFTLTNYRDLYDQGVNRSSDILFNYSTLEVTIRDNTLSLPFADVFRTIEDYLATQQGILFTLPPFPVIIDTGSGVRNYLFFPEQAPGLPNPVRILPDATNTADPTLTDFVIVLPEATAPLFDIFDFTGASGRTIRFQTEAVAANIQVSGSGALTTEQATQLASINTRTARVDGLIENVSGDQFTAKAVSQAPSGGGSSITEASIYTYFTSESRQNQFKADVSGVSTHTAADVIVALEASTTASNITAILEDTSITLPTSITAASDAVIARGNTAWTTFVFPGSAPTDWIGAGSVSSGAVTKIQDSLATSTDVGAVNTSLANLNTTTLGLSTSIGDLETDVTGLSNTVGILNTSITGQSTDINNLTTGINTLTSTVTNTNNVLATVDADLLAINVTLNTLNTSVNASVLASEANAKGEAIFNESNSTYQLFDTTGTSFVIFDVVDSQGNPATNASDIVRRIPR